jgi:hypothetical protein
MEMGMRMRMAYGHAHGRLDMDRNEHVVGYGMVLRLTALRKIMDYDLFGYGAFVWLGKT